MKKIFFKIFSFILAFFLLIPNISQTAFAVANETFDNYSNVLEDLSKDENFKPEDYPDAENDYSLKIIQVAETKGNEVLIYVYNPSAKTKGLTATKISLSTVILDNYSPEFYELVKLNENGVFQKYKVKDLKVKSDVVRYYEISEILRPFDETIDTAPDNGNTISEVAYKIAQRWTACTLEGEVYYNCEITEVVDVTDKFVGFVDLPAGENLLTWLYQIDGSCQSHFVAFKTDHNIDELLEADLTFTRQSRAYYDTELLDSSFGSAITEKITLNHTDETEVELNVAFTRKNYAWKNIQTPEEFFNSVEFDNVYNMGLIDKTVKTKLNEEDKARISNMQYILRFYESEYKVENRKVGNPYMTSATLPVKYTQETVVTDVAILRLKFLYNGKIYNLGVVDDIQSGSGNSSTVEEVSYQIADWLKKSFVIVFVILGLVLLMVILQLCHVLKPVLIFIGKSIVLILKGLWWLISAPFTFLKSLIKKE